MIHEKIELHVPGSANYAAMYTYFLDLSKEVPIEKRPTVIVCPGGAYAFTSDREAEPIAMRFNAIGMNAVVVRYSVAPARFPTALLEVATAVKYVREEGVKYGCDPEKVFTIGFSAGGHLAASYGNFWSRPFVAEAMNCPSELLRPNGQILSYPVITSGPFAHHDSIKNLLGEQYELEKANQSLENFVTKDTPPTFVWHTQPDDCVPVSKRSSTCSRRAATACRFATKSPRTAMPSSCRTSASGSTSQRSSYRAFNHRFSVITNE